MSKRKTETEDERFKRCQAEVDRMIDLGEINASEAEDRLARMIEEQRNEAMGIKPPMTPDEP